MECIQLVCLDTAKLLFTNESLKVKKNHQKKVNHAFTSSVSCLVVSVQDNAGWLPAIS